MLLFVPFLAVNCDTCHGIGMELLRFLRDTGPLHAMLWQHLELAVAGWPKVSSLVRKGKDLVSWSMKESWPKSVPLRRDEE